jgi:hypothetical protein
MGNAISTAKSTSTLQKSVLKSVKELYPCDWVRVPPPPLQLDSVDEFGIDDSFEKQHLQPCPMCAELNCGPRCQWICCGFVACQGCALHYYKNVRMFGACVACESPFPAGSTYTDVIKSPTSVVKETIAFAPNFSRKGMCYDMFGHLICST